MDILDNIAEEYTFNGVISIKAIEDDIETLKNQIDSDRIILSELRTRGMNDEPIVSRIRYVKARMALLKTVLQREKKRAASDNVMVNMLEQSALLATENKKVETAAARKKPVPQSFESVSVDEEITCETTVVTMEKTENDIDKNAVFLEK